MTAVGFFLIFLWDRYHQQELTDKKGMGEVVDVKAQLMFIQSCAHSCVWRRRVPVALWLLGSWDDCNRGASSWDNSSLMGRPPKVRWRTP